VPSLEHVVDGREDRSGTAMLTFLGPRRDFDPMELGLVVAVLRSRGRPRALCHRRLGPWSAFAQAVERRLAALSSCREVGEPKDSVRRGGEPVHVEPDSEMMT
jgi:hypothetical protein